jgi:hypothetical protein
VIKGKGDIMKKASLLICFLLIVFAICSCTKKCTQESIDDDGVCVKCGETVEGEGEETGGNTGGEKDDPDHIHSFTQRIRDPEYLVEDLKCGATEKYYYSCTCGEKGESIFFTSYTIEHELVDGSCVNCPARQSSEGLDLRKHRPEDPFTFAGVGSFEGEHVVVDLYGKFKVGIIDSGALSFTDKVKSIYIGNDVTEIRMGAFAGCTSLESVHIGSRVRKIALFDDGASAFEGNKNLKSITVDEDNPFFTSIDGNLYTKDGKRLLVYCLGKEETTFTIPDSVTEIEYELFKDCDNLLEINTGNGLKNVSYGYFDGCKNLTTLNVGTGVEAIYGLSLNNLTKLENINVSEGNAHYKTDEGILYTKDGTMLVYYPRVRTESHFVIHDGITEIGSYAFSGCSNLREVTFCSDVINVGISSFSNCVSLEVVHLNEGLQYIGEYAFSGCEALTDIVFKDPEGWKTGNQLISSDELSNSATAADYLTDSMVYFPFLKSEEP